MSSTLQKQTNKRKGFINVRIFICVIVFLACMLFSLFVLPEITEYCKLVKTVQSLEFDAIEAKGVMYYPTTVPVMWVPSSLPPIGSQTVYKVINNKTNYDCEYLAETFYNEDFLYFDEIVFCVYKATVLEIIFK